MNQTASRILGSLSPAKDNGEKPELNLGFPPRERGTPEAIGDWIRGDSDPMEGHTEFEPLGRFDIPMKVEDNPFNRDYQIGTSSPDALPHYDSNDFMETLWNHKIVAPMNMIPDAMNLGLELVDLVRMTGHPKAREQLVDFVWTMAKGSYNYSIENGIFDGPMTPDGQVFTMAMEDIMNTFMDPKRKFEQPFTQILDLMDGAGFMLKGLGTTAMLAGRTKSFGKMMNKARELAADGELGAATAHYTKTMRKLREEAVGRDAKHIQMLENRLEERLNQLYGHDSGQTVDQRLAAGDNPYTYETPGLTPKYREFWHTPLKGDLPQPHASVEDGMALAVEVFGPSPTGKQIEQAIEIIRTSDPRWSKGGDPVPTAIRDMFGNMKKASKKAGFPDEEPFDYMQRIYAEALTYARQLERAKPGTLDEILNWYPTFGKNILEEVGENNFHEAAVLFGITSQQSPVEQNLTDTFWVMNEVRKYMEKPGVNMIKKFNRQGLIDHLRTARTEDPGLQAVRHTIEKMSSYQKKNYKIGAGGGQAYGQDIPRVGAQDGPLSITGKEYKAFITEKSINRIVDFYQDGFFSGDTKTQTYVSTLLHLTLGNGTGFFPWTTQDQHMARIFQVFETSKTGVKRDIGDFGHGDYRAAQYMTLKLARANGMSGEQMQALLWFYSKNVLAKSDDAGMAGRYGGGPSIAPGRRVQTSISGPDGRPLQIYAEGRPMDFGTWESASEVSRNVLADLKTRLDVRESLLPQTKEATIDLQKMAFPAALNRARQMDQIIEKSGVPARTSGRALMEGQPEELLHPYGLEEGTSPGGSITVGPPKRTSLLVEQSRARQRQTAAERRRKRSR